MDLFGFSLRLVCQSVFVMAGLLMTRSEVLRQHHMEFCEQSWCKGRCYDVCGVLKGIMV